MERLFSIVCLSSVLALANAEIRIVGGNNANARQFPYHAEIQIEGNEHRCGGGIIGERYILTAAHCVVEDILDKNNKNILIERKFENNKFKVVAGVADMTDRRNYRTISVQTIYVPKSYFSKVLQDDIAVLKLAENIGLRYGLKKLDLPKRNQWFDGQTAKIAGHGYTSWNKQQNRGSSDKKMKYLDVKIIPLDECEIETGVLQTLTMAHICGQAVQRGMQMSGICNGDSGGPLVIGNTIIGIVSMGTTNCQENNAHSRYTRVTSYLDFIKNVMNGPIGDNIISHVVPKDKIVGEQLNKNDKFVFPE